MPFRCKNPSEPWNSGPNVGNPLAPWNNPMKRDNPSACWNNPAGCGLYREECNRYK
ncbi:TPA_asm: hypothetical protein [Porphyromonas phage phage011a_WW2952]|uniref:Uncharacterized protein n=1 Tax=Porphyromonas phage phage011a_WW2952 TaxID=3154101 RepID=A0AAT9J848_9CAUD